MRRANTLLLVTLLLAACASAPPPPEAPARRQALEVEHDGAKRYARADYAGAVSRFREAARRFTGIDDANGTARNRLHEARATLGAGQPAAAAALAAALHADTAYGLDALLLSAQAALAADAPAASGYLDAAAVRCGKACPQQATLALLRARLALAAGTPAQALPYATQAQALLQGKDDALELANAWRLAAEAQLALGDKAAAHAAAQTALELDRRLALPEKIARDWLLLARAGSGAEARAAYERAATIAAAANLSEIANLAQHALTQESKP